MIKQHYLIYIHQNGEEQNIIFEEDEMKLCENMKDILLKLKCIKGVKIVESQLWEIPNSLENIRGEKK